MLSMIAVLVVANENDVRAQLRPGSTEEQDKPKASQRIKVEGEYKYTYGDRESLVEAKNVACTIAAQKAVESYQVFIEATSAVQDYKLRDDLIRTISSGYLQDLRILEQSEQGRTLFCKVRGYLLPSVINKVIEIEKSRLQGQGANRKEDSKSPGTKAFNFAFSVLTALHYCNWARDYAVQFRDSSDMYEMMTNLMTQNNKFGLAQSAIANYVGDSDEDIDTVSKGVALAIDMHIDANDKILQKLKKIGAGDLTVAENIKYEMAEIDSQHKQAWELLLRSSAFILGVLVEPAKSNHPAGPIPFKIPEQEKMALLKYLDDLFGGDLKRYYAYREAARKGLKGDPNAQTYVIFAVDHIRGALVPKTYEDAASLKRD